MNGRQKELTTMFDIMKGARPDEIFHVQVQQPIPLTTVWGAFRKTVWSDIYNPDGSIGTFTSCWLWKLQWYWGTTKCDGTRTYMLNLGQLGDPTPGYVMTTTPKELKAFRWRSNGPGIAVWSNMGGS